MKTGHVSDRHVVIKVINVYQELESEGTFKNTEVVIAGLSNAYTHYITTYEEYQVFMENLSKPIV